MAWGYLARDRVVRRLPVHTVSSEGPGCPVACQTLKVASLSESKATVGSVVEYQRGCLRGLAHEIRTVMRTRSIEDRALMRSWVSVIEQIEVELGQLDLRAERTSGWKRLKAFGKVTLGVASLTAAMLSCASDSQLLFEDPEAVPEGLEQLVAAVTQNVSQLGELTGTGSFDADADNEIEADRFASTIAGYMFGALGEASSDVYRPSDRLIVNYKDHRYELVAQRGQRSNQRTLWAQSYGGNVFPSAQLVERHLLALLDDNSSGADARSN